MGRFVQSFDDCILTIRALGAGRTREWIPRVLFYSLILAANRWPEVQSKLSLARAGSDMRKNSVATYITITKSYTDVYNIYIVCFHLFRARRC